MKISLSHNIKKKIHRKKKGRPKFFVFTISKKISKQKKREIKI